MVEVLPDDAPSPRLCHLIKWPDFDGYGFNLHAERSNPGQFIGKIDDDSPAQMAGLREGDRIVEVNGVNISNENHRQVVERIKSDPSETKLLVVDPQTDLWYKEQDIVVKSSQMNVIYKKTPVPRPSAATSGQADSTPTDYGSGNVNQAAPVSPTTTTTSGANNGASSLDTSDFNDDSIEQQVISKKQPAAVDDKHYDVVTPPPMSPDSGKGDEVVEQQPQVVTVEAEINHQTPAMNTNENNADSAKLITSAISSPASKFNKVSKSPQMVVAPSHEEMQPDSLTSNHHRERQSEQDRVRKSHNGSADSGKSSSPDGTTSNSSSSSSSGSSSRGSIADSLEEQTMRENNNNNNLATINNKVNNNNVDEVGPVRTVIKNSTTTGATPTPNNHHQKPASDVTVATNAQTPKITTTTTKLQQAAPTAAGDNNNFSGLNLNMTASEMRELIARRKKFDPKKAQMNIRQKYEIIQQM